MTSNKQWEEEFAYYFRNGGTTFYMQNGHMNITQEFKDYITAHFIFKTELAQVIEGMIGNLAAMSKTDASAIAQTKGYRAALNDLKAKLGLT